VLLLQLGFLIKDCLCSFSYDGKETQEMRSKTWVE
jgi:hypothetical protein